MAAKSTSFRVGDYEVSATFSGERDPAVFNCVRQILLASFAGSIAKNSSGAILADSQKERYTVSGGQHHAP